MHRVQKVALDQCFKCKYINTIFFLPIDLHRLFGSLTKDKWASSKTKKDIFAKKPELYATEPHISHPICCRSDPHMTVNVKKFDKEDIVLMLPPEKPTLEDLQHFQVWCRKFEQNFGEFVMA